MTGLEHDARETEIYLNKGDLNKGVCGPDLYHLVSGGPVECGLEKG